MVDTTVMVDMTAIAKPIQLKKQRIHVVGIEQLRQIFETRAFDEFQWEELAPGRDMQSERLIRLPLA